MSFILQRVKENYTQGIQSTTTALFEKKISFHVYVITETNQHIGNQYTNT
jgi:hypothetical protein